MSELTKAWEWQKREKRRKEKAMIAVVKEKYRGIKSIDASEILKRSERILDKFSSSEREMIERYLVGGIEYVDNPIFHTRSFARDMEKHFDEDKIDFSMTEARLMPFDIFDYPDEQIAKFRPLNNEQEQELFVKYNYARYMICKLVKNHKNKRITISFVRELLGWIRRVLKIRSQIANANIPLVLAMAKRSKVNGVEFSELISEGNLALLRSIDKFDCSRGYKFSTYACRSILKSFARIAMKTARYRGRFPVEFDADLERSDFVSQKREDTRGYYVDRLRDMLNSDVTGLSEIEKDVVSARFALGKSDKENKPLTLEQVGEIIGVTKERVRQIQNKALKKLKLAMEEQVLNR